MVAPLLFYQVCQGVQRMVARDIMNQDVVTVRVTDSIRCAAHKMLEAEYAALPVVDDEDQVVGLLSETDILALTLPEYLHSVADLGFLPKSLQFPAPGARDLDTTKVGDILRTDILEVVEADEPVIEVVRLMVTQHVRRCPVVEKGKLVGIIARRDLMQIIVRPTIEANPEQ